MPQTLEELQNAPYGEICSALADLAPSVIAAREQYQALAAQQSALVAARELISAGVRLGDKVRIQGRHNGKVCPLAIVVGANSGGPEFQILDKKGQPQGEYYAAFEFDGFDKI